MRPVGGSGGIGPSSGRHRGRGADEGAGDKGGGGEPPPVPGRAGFAPGQELSAHTAPYPAILYFAQGEADLLLGGDAREAHEGTLVHMAPKLEHGIKAKTEVVMLLVMLKS